jgi:hypothetical protein
MVWGVCLSAANNLGADLQRFGEEAHKLSGHKAAMRAAQVWDSYCDWKAV